MTPEQVFAERLGTLTPSLRILGTVTFLGLGCKLHPLVDRLKQGVEDDEWLLASLSAKVTANWNGSEAWFFKHLAAPMFGIDEDAAALDYWLTTAQRVIPTLRSRWLWRMMAQATQNENPEWLWTALKR